MEPVVWSTLGTTCRRCQAGLEIPVDFPMWSLVSQQDWKKLAQIIIQIVKQIWMCRRRWKPIYHCWENHQRFYCRVIELEEKKSKCLLPQFMDWFSTQERFLHAFQGRISGELPTDRQLAERDDAFVVFSQLLSFCHRILFFAFVSIVPSRLSLRDTG